MPAPPTEIPASDFDAAADFLRGGDGFLVTSHVNADGDAIGAVLAMEGLLRQLGKASTAVLEERPGDAYAFLPGTAGIVEAGAAGGGHQRAIVLDCSNLARTGPVAECLADGASVLNIDHHPDNQRFGSANLASEAVSSTCEMLYHLAVHMDLELDRSLSELLAAGLLFDTCCFRYSLTTPTSMEVGADLRRRGARLDRVADGLYSNATLGSVKLLGRAIDSLELHCGDRVALLGLNRRDLALGDPEAIVNYGLMVRGVEAAALLREEEPGRFRVSLRSRGDDVDVSAVARHFGGGGHAQASGCRIEGEAAAVRSRLLAAVEEVLR